MKGQKTLANNNYLLQKFPGKGGWTYAAIPEIVQIKNNPFGWVKVKGFIDDYELNQYKLMPMGKGRLFLPVKASIRKIIKKKAGDYVHIILELDDSELKVPNEILSCFQNEPKSSLIFFNNLPEGGQKSYIDWINSAKTIETKTKRIIEMMDRLQDRLGLHDKK